MTLDLPDAAQVSWAPFGPDLVVEGDNLPVPPALPDGAFRLAYLDPPFNSGREQLRRTTITRHDPIGGTRMGFHGRPYDVVKSTVTRYDDAFTDYWAFLEPRLEEVGGCSPRTARSTSTWTSGRCTTRRCCSTRCSAASAS